jgi:hypothetical protein
MRRVLLAIGLAVSPAAAVAQEPGSVLSEKGIETSSGRFRLKAEIKLNFRDSTSDSFTVGGTGAPFPIVLATVSPNASSEVSNIALIGEADLTPHILGHFQINFLDLYNRNPTSSSDRVFVREAWLRFGKKYDSVQAAPDTSFYLEAGKFPRFSKQIVRRMESYGLWGTAVGRFEEVGAEIGGSIGPHVYWRGSTTNGNPLFMRDPNALAGDNGTPERTVGSTTPVVYQAGFPILYDTQSTDVNGSGRFQYGGGLGVRFNWGEGNRDGVDAMGWYFRRTLADRVSLHGTFYSGDLRLLGGNPIPLPVTGNEKTEYGANLEARIGPVHIFGQYVHQDIAGLVRHGYEAEVAWRIPLPGLFASGDSSVVNWIQPVVRVSAIEYDFAIPAGFVAPSFGWNWHKYDAGLRIGIIRGLDLTAEYARNDTRARSRVLHPDEFLMTLRAVF